MNVLLNLSMSAKEIFRHLSGKKPARSGKTEKFPGGGKKMKKTVVFSGNFRYTDIVQTGGLRAVAGVCMKNDGYGRISHYGWCADSQF